MRERLSSEFSIPTLLSMRVFLSAKSSGTNCRADLNVFGWTDSGPQAILSLLVDAPIEKGDIDAIKEHVEHALSQGGMVLQLPIYTILAMNPDYLRKKILMHVAGFCAN